MINSVCTKAHAKINLTLDVVGKQDNGYHLIESVMQSIELCDEIKLSVTNTDAISLSCSDPKIPCDERNTVYRACVKFFSFTGVSNPGIDIYIEKQIPSEAGLGGGSSDAAAIIRLLDEIFETKLSLDEMIKIGVSVGADVPFCIVSGTALCEGLGEIVTPLPKLKTHHVLLVKPDFGVSTPLAYNAFDDNRVLSSNATKAMVTAITDGDDITKLISNDLEKAINYDDINTIKTRLMDLGADGALMTGSGSCVYGLFSDKGVALSALNCIKNDYPFVCLSKTI